MNFIDPREEIWKRFLKDAYFTINVTKKNEPRQRSDLEFA